VALAWEPIGQGERVQLYDKDFEVSKVVRSTTEHTIVGIQCLLVGDNLARYTIWDGMRALDYLLSRKEVDPKRIGCTGNSGGGTHTAYLSALDDRIHVAAPSCYITSWERLLATIGPQDAEQCIPPWLADGLDHPDFIYAFAPKPYLMLSAIRDFFSIYGARSTFGEAKRVYELLGAGEKLNMVEADDGHGYSKPRRLASYRWFSRWLKGVDDEAPEPEVTIATPEELYCTETGQVATSVGGETVFSLNQKRLEEVRRGGVRSSAEDVRQMVKFRKPETPLNTQFFGRIERPGYGIEKLVYESEPGIRVPSLLYIPKEPAGKKAAAVFLHGQGKAEAHSEVEELAKAGLVVLAIDARGLGETRRASDGNGSDWPRYFGDYESAMGSLLTGKPLVAMRAEDVSRGVDLLVSRAEVDRDKVYAFGRGTGAVPVLYAAALDSRIRKLALEEMLVSYESVVRNRIHRQVFENIVRGALRSYDLPDLIGWLAPRPVWVVDAVDPMQKLVPVGEVSRQYTRSREAFQRAGAEAELRILRRKPADTAATLYRGML
jgi:cephalosporin-C deacetylase-like acetyl esterase